MVLDWKSFVSDKTPVILPSQFDSSQNVFVKLNNHYYPLLAGFIDSPSKTDFNKYKEQLDKRETSLIFRPTDTISRFQMKNLIFLDSDVLYKPKNNTGNKQRLQNLSFGTPHSQLLVFEDKGLRKPGFYGLKLVYQELSWPMSGIIARTTSRFVRPQSMKDFTINNLNFNER